MNIYLKTTGIKRYQTGGTVEVEGQARRQIRHNREDGQRHSEYNKAQMEYQRRLLDETFDKRLMELEATIKDPDQLRFAKMRLEDDRIKVMRGSDTRIRWEDDKLRGLGVVPSPSPSSSPYMAIKPDYPTVEDLNRHGNELSRARARARNSNTPSNTSLFNRP